MANALMKSQKGRRMVRAGRNRGLMGGGAQPLPIPVALKSGDNRDVLLPNARPSSPTFIFTVANGGASAQTVIMFDDFEFVTETEGYTQSGDITITGVTAPYAAVKKAVASNPIQIVGMTYKASDEAFQTLKFRRMDLDGSDHTDVVNPQMAIRNTQFQADILTFQLNQVLDGNTAFVFVVPAGQTATFTFFIGATLNRLT